MDHVQIINFHLSTVNISVEVPHNNFHHNKHGLVFVNEYLISTTIIIKAIANHDAGSTMNNANRVKYQLRN